MTTPYHAKLWANLLQLRGGDDPAARLAHSLGTARVDLNPHQVAAAVFAMQALRLGPRRGTLLADEVGLGKTIEAGLVLAQYWAEGRRRLLLVVPAMLRKQWQAELREKFGLPAEVIDGQAAHQGGAGPRVWIVSYHLAARVPAGLLRGDWDLAVLDEAHRMRGTNRGGAMATAIMTVLRDTPRMLLTATPLQNNLLELHALAQVLDPYLFGDVASFREQFMRSGPEAMRNTLLRQRLEPVCTRTLRRQVHEYVRFTRRTPVTRAFVPSDDEHALYEDVSEWLRTPVSVALPAGQRQLITMVLRKLLASSTMAVAGALRTIIGRVESDLGLSSPLHHGDEPTDLGSALADDFEAGSDVGDELRDPSVSPAAAAAPTDTLATAKAEIALLRCFAERAEAIGQNSKSDALLLAIGEALAQAKGLGAAEKAVVFTESRRTQVYLLHLLRQAGYAAVGISGAHTDGETKRIYGAWLDRHRGDGSVSGVRQADVRAALVEEFRERATVLVATEAAAEGVNLQFCSLVINYDLPWNPQRVEQRIGRCHRYGQKHDVVVVNFLNQRNAADARVLQLLTDKFLLFDGVFGCSDEVLGAVQSGVDLERQIAAIYQNCRTAEEINQEFDHLQEVLRPLIDHRLDQTREQILTHFDQDVQEHLRVHRDRAKELLDERQRWLLDLLRFELNGRAEFAADRPALAIRQPPHSGDFHLDWRQAERFGVQHLGQDHPLAVECIERAAGRSLPDGSLEFQLVENALHGRLAALRGQVGSLQVLRVTAPGPQADEALLTVALTDDGEVLDSELAGRLWELPAHEVELPPAAPAVGLALAAAVELAVADETERLRQARAELLDQESDKLGRWAEDEKLALRLDIERLDDEIAQLQRQVRQVAKLEDKLRLRRQERDLDQQRTAKRQQLFQAQDRIDAERNRLLDALEATVTGLVQVAVVMAGRWRVHE